MQTPGFLVVLAIFLLCALVQHTHAGPHSWRGAPAMFNKLMKQAKPIRDGKYHLQNAETGGYMMMISKGNDIRIAKDKRGKGSDMGAKGEVFKIVHHPHPRYRHLYSIHHPNSSGRDKCISAGYSHNANTFALMYMCRVETKSGGSGGVTSPGSTIRYDKQLWIFIPGSRGTFKIITVAHLKDVKPRCIFPRHVAGYGAMKPHHYRGLALAECVLNNSKGKKFNWRLVRA